MFSFFWWSLKLIHNSAISRKKSPTLRLGLFGWSCISKSNEFQQGVCKIQCRFCRLYHLHNTIQYNNQIQQSPTNFNIRCPKPFVDLQQHWFVALQAPKLIFDNMCEKSYVDFVDSGWPEPKILGLENNVDFVVPKTKHSFSTLCVKNHMLIL